VVDKKPKWLKLSFSRKYHATIPIYFKTANPLFFLNITLQLFDLLKAMAFYARAPKRADFSIHR
jgi:hypothetical protein